jgi:histidyl-tRNA synthetase
MGDVVLRIVLEELGLLERPEHYLPRPDLFAIAASDEAAAQLPGWVSRWRRGGLHVRHSNRTTRNVGKLLGEAARARARFAVILGAGLAEGRVDLKDLESGEQAPVAIDAVLGRIAPGGTACTCSS